jgi:hypothetical protein
MRQEIQILSGLLESEQETLLKVLHHVLKSL